MQLLPLKELIDLFDMKVDNPWHKEKSFSVCSKEYLQGLQLMQFVKVVNLELLNGIVRYIAKKTNIFIN